MNNAVVAKGEEMAKSLAPLIKMLEGGVMKKLQK